MINLHRLCTLICDFNEGLPQELIPWALDRRNPAAERHKFWPGLFGRLDYNEQFQTAVTEVNPLSKQGVSKDF